MKKIIFLVPLLFLIYGFYSNMILEYTIQGIIKQLQVGEDDVKNIIWSDITSPGFYFPNPKELKNAAKGDRASIVKVVGNYVKEFTATENFKQRYLEYRENQKPQYPKGPISVDSLKKDYKEQLTKSIEDMEKNMSNLPADQKPTFEELIKNMKQQLKDVDDPEKTMYTPEMDNIYKQQYEQEVKYYNENLKKWETDYPLDSKWLVKRWLNEFLEKSKDVDFNAGLLNKGNKKIFEKQEYEQKDYLWKICFRTGKEATESARTFAKSWLNDLK